ncbi:pectate lyase family protein [Melioribacter sp. OK-6-Me]|uniref:pectate lyase family protein n=1 Tax=unclassified Melioribacter TaxID=2627329 RepID=UPI003ED90333
MKKLIPIFLFLSFQLIFSQETIIQENEIGFCSVDGKIDSSVSGYTGEGYADTDFGIGKSISWQIYVSENKEYSFIWRYAVGGTDDRNARLVIDGNVIIDTVYFPTTVDWKNWRESDTLKVFLLSGSHKIRIEALAEKGLGNYDYFKILGGEILPDNCTPSYTVNINTNNLEWGTVSYTPVKDYYDAGTEITLTAHPNPGYFLDCWMGTHTSNDSIFTFKIEQNVEVTARFLPSGIQQDTNLIGYAGILDDRGTTFTLIGGALGDTVTARSLDDLKKYLGSPQPYYVQFEGMLEGEDVVTVTSDKTLIGTGVVNYLKGIELSINNARNVIVKNITISHVKPQDALEINGKSQNIWIDHCEFFSDRNHGIDYYDGLLDIKNESSFITVSWSHFHDHYKTILISSGDEQYADTVIRVTFHHNLFDNCESRLPSIRFGRAHIFNNYYKNCNTAINTRMGAWVRVENNYFENVGKAVMSDYSVEKGYALLFNNYLVNSSILAVDGCNYEVPYNYTPDDPEILPAIIQNSVITDIVMENPSNFDIECYPNPFNPSTTIKYYLPENSFVELKVYDLLGRELKTLISEHQIKGNHTYRLSMNEFGKSASSLYLCRLNAGKYSKTIKLLLLK